MTTSAPHLAPVPRQSGSATVLPARGLVPFLLVSFGWSWLTWWLGPLVVDATDAGILMLLVIIGGFGPAIGAVVVTAATEGRSGVGALLGRFRPRGHGGIRPLLLSLVIVGVILATIPVALATGMRLDPAGVAAGLASLPVMIVLVALAGGGNEELGWRGFMLPRLQSALSPLASSIVLGLVWAVWHAPLWSLAGSSQSRLSFPVYVVLVIGISIVLTHVTNTSRGGLIGAVAAHTAVNVTAGLAASALGGVREVDQAVAMVVFALVVIAATRGRLGLDRSLLAPAPALASSAPVASVPEGHRY